MNPIELLSLLSCGVGVGVLAGILGVGGGVILVPILVGFHYSPINAVATSSFCVAMTTMSATAKNWKQGHIETSRLLSLAIPGMITTQVGVFAASHSKPWILLGCFASLLLFCIYLMNLKEKLLETSIPGSQDEQSSLIGKYLITGSSAGFLSGMFGVGGGIVLVPLQILFFGTSIKAAVRTSLGVILLTSIMSSLGHGFKGNILYYDGMALGIGGMFGAQFGTYFLHKISNTTVKTCFRVLLIGLSGFLYWKAWTAFV